MVPFKSVVRHRWAERMSPSQVFDAFELLRNEALEEVRMAHTSERFELLANRIAAIDLVLDVLERKEGAS